MTLQPSHAYVLHHRKTCFNILIGTIKKEYWYFWHPVHTLPGIAENGSEFHDHDCFFLFSQFSLEMIGIKVILLPGIILLVEFAFVKDIDIFL